MASLDEVLATFLHNGGGGAFAYASRLERSSGVVKAGKYSECTTVRILQDDTTDLTKQPTRSVRTCVLKRSEISCMADRIGTKWRRDILSFLAEHRYFAGEHATFISMTMPSCHTGRTGNIAADIRLVRAQTRWSFSRVKGAQVSRTSILC